MLNEALGILPIASDHGHNIDQMLEFCHWFMLALFVGWLSYFIIVLWKFRASKHPKADYHGVQSHASTHIEFSVILIEAVILLGFGLPLWGRRTNDIPKDAADRLEVRAIGYQFGWQFHYPGPDNRFGRQHTRYINAQNPLGLDPNDAAGNDDFFSTNELHLINFKPTVIRVTSKDVIHGLALHQMRVQQDAIPGMEVPMWFRPNKLGKWEIICAQLCGTGHSVMRADYIVEDEKSFRTFEQEALSLKPGYKKPEAPTVAAN